MAKRRNTSTDRIVDLASNPYWREADAREALDLLADSGQSLAAFARETGFSQARLRYWSRKLEDGAGAKTPSDPSTNVRFLPVVAVNGADDDGDGGETAAPAVEGALVELVLSSGHTVRLRAGFDPDILARLLDVLEAR